MVGTVDAATARKRRNFKNCTRKNFVDGWVEFERKRVAKQVAEALNNTPIGMETVLFLLSCMGNGARVMMVSMLCSQVAKKEAIITMIYGICAICEVLNGIT